MVKCLIEKGANLNGKHGYGQTVLHLGENKLEVIFLIDT